ncbi:MAG TPA: Crp/Fnr family transcriptional regulator [Burkholderiales bacterium]|nr:Crp/Fnr family transcriptional regulator [Burkholderiales bacterium]
MKQDLKVESFLANVPLLKEASAEEIARIAQGTRALHLARGETLFHKGDMPQGFYLVVYGQVKLAFISPQGADKVVELIGPGMTFGEAVMFLDLPHVVYAQTLTDSMLLQISSAAVFQELELNAKFARKMLGGLSRRLHGIVSDVEAYCMHSGAQRVIGYLLRDAEQLDGGKELDIELSTNKGVIASRLNLTPQHFSRILHELSEAGLVQVNGRTVHITDLNKLREAS